MKKLNILIINSLNIYGGGEFFVNQLSSKLKELGHNVWVSCRKDNLIYSNCIKNNINVYPLEFPGRISSKGVLKISKQLAKFARENKIDIIHSNTNYDRTCGAIASMLSGTVHIASIHSFQSIKHNISHWIRNKYFINHFIVNSRNTKELLIKKDRISSDKISLIYMGLNPEEYKYNEDQRNFIRNKYGIKEYEILIGNMARMVPFKGHDILIKTFYSVYKHNYNVKLMIIGDGELRLFLEKLIKEYGIESNIILTGYKENFKEFYSAFDLYAHTSLEGGGESFPYAMLYALAYKLPIAATRAGDAEAIVINNKNGYVVDNKDIDTLAEKLLHLINNKELRESFGKESLDLLNNNYTENEMIRKIEEVYYKSTGVS